MLEYSAIALREERRCAVSIADVADASIEIAGGVASRGKPGLWLNTALAVGLTSPVSPDDVVRLAEFHEQVSAEPRIEVSPFSHPSLLRELSAAGFQLRGFENVLYRELRTDEIARPPQATPPEVRIAPLDATDDAAVAAFSLAVATGFADGEAPSAGSIELTARSARHHRTASFAAYVGERCVGGGSVELFDGQAALWGLSVLPEFRRRGIQQALLAARLNYAAQRGASLATISGLPGMGTERNVRRLGFQLAYTKVVLTRPRAGLLAVSG